AEPELMASDPPDLALAWPWEIDADRAIELAVACEAAARNSDPRITHSEGATLTTQSGSLAYGNTHGFVCSYAKTRHGLRSVFVGEPDGLMERDFHYTTARDAPELETPEHVGTTAAQRTVARLGARKIRTTKAPVLFTPELARGFIGHMVGAISGGAQYRRASFLLDAAGERVFPEFVTIEEQIGRTSCRGRL